jgi:Fe-S oxidoreductase
MKINMTLEEIRGAASLCLKCGKCTYGDWPQNHLLCPIYAHDRCYAYSAGGLLYLALALMNQQIVYSMSVAELVFSCPGCLACDSQCDIIRSQSPHVEPWDIVRRLRYECVRNGYIPAGRARKIYDEIEKKGHFGEPSDLKLSKKINRPKSKTVIFNECTHTKTQKDITAATARLLEKIHQPVAQFAEQGCCGSTLYDLGFWDKLTPYVESNWEAMKKSPNKTFVFVNPHCQEFIKKRYPEIVPGSEDIKAQHISQLLVNCLKTGKLKNKKGDKIKVSYHDPCYLGRGLGIYDAPRTVLALLEGVTLVEMERNRENSFCCGARAVGSYFPDIIEWTAQERLKEFEATGADLLITACAYCKETFQKVLPEKDRSRVKDITEFVDERTV